MKATNLIYNHHRLNNTTGIYTQSDDDLSYIE